MVSKGTTLTLILALNAFVSQLVLADDTPHHRVKTKKVKVVPTKVHVPVKAPVVKSKPVPVPQPTVIVTPKCPDEYEFVGKDCVSRHEIPEQHMCPPGSDEHHGSCEKRVEGQFTCPPNFTLRDKMCVSIEESAMVNQCPNGSFHHGNACVIKLDHAPRCPDGTARLGERCARFTPMVLECPTGYTPRGDLCATQMYEDPDSVCPTGTYPEGNVCKLVTTIEETCPTGTVDIGEHCATYANKRKECPKGYSMQGKVCVRTEKAAKIPVCANGGDPEEKCVVTIPVPPSPYCKVGKMCSTGQCVKPKRLKPQYNCPSGYSLQHGSKCIKVTTYDCTKTHQDIECEHVSTGKNTPHVRHRLLNVDSKGKYQNVQYSKLGAIPKCQKKAPVVPKTCEKVHTATAEGYCSEGVFKGTHCEIKEYFAPEYKCDALTDSHGDCHVEERTPVLYTCPAGYTKTSQGCTRTEMEQPHYFCPPGTVEPNCATFVDKVCLGGRCDTKIIESPRLICPEGFHMINGAHNFESHKKFKHSSHQGYHTSYDGPKCTKTIYTEKAPGCPRGTVQVEGLNCASFVDIQVHKSDRKVPMQHLCPLGYAEEGGKCIKKVVHPAEVLCGPGATLYGMQCIKTVPQVAACPHGSKREHGRCWAVSHVTPIMIKEACAYDVSKASCRGHYTKAAPKTPTYKVKKVPQFKKTRHHGGPVLNRPVVMDGKSY